MPDRPKREFNIKNMVCPRCELVVRQTLEQLGFTVLQVELGLAVVEDREEIPSAEVNRALQVHGFELLEGKDRKLVERIKTLLIRYVQELEEAEEVPTISGWLTGHLNRDYSILSSAFSKSEEITIEKYVIRLKIERVRELLSYDELTLSEIAHRMNYSSVSHLSNQFRQIAGMSVTDYKKARDTFRKPLDGL